MKHWSYPLFLLLLLAVACTGNQTTGEPQAEDSILTDSIPADTMLYGILVEGMMNSVTLATDDGDTLELLIDGDDTQIDGPLVCDQRYAFTLTPDSQHIATMVMVNEDVE